MRTITLQFHLDDDAPALDSGYVAPDVAMNLIASAPNVFALSEHEIQNQAEGIAARAYRETVSGIVANLTRAVKDGVVIDRDDLETWLHETIDGHGDVIYTARAMEVCRQSRNDGAYFDEFGDEGAVSDGGIEWSKLAYCALMADVREELSDVDERFFRCDECGADVEADYVQAAAGSDDLPRCASCVEGDEPEDEDEEDETGEDDEDTEAAIRDEEAKRG